LNGHDFFGRTGGNYAPAVVAAFGAEVNNVVRAFDHIQVMFNHEHGVTVASTSLFSTSSSFLMS
jgi:hypothetical protein